VGDLAYVAGGGCSDGCWGSLSIIDVSNPASPVELGTLYTPDYANDVEVVGDLAYVADGYFGIQVIDVSNPAFPVEIGALDTPDYATDVAVVGNLAYVADYESGLRIIDFGPEYLASQCGGPGFVQLNLKSSLVSDTVCLDSLNSYWFPGVAGEPYTVRVATVTGDPDLYGATERACIESLPTPGGGCTYESSTTAGLAPEEIQFTAEATGPYYIGVHGITDGTYTIEVVPEPASWLMLVAGMAFLGVLYRRRVRGLQLG
jgi:hypothetical protein